MWLLPEQFMLYKFGRDEDVDGFTAEENDEDYEDNEDNEDDEDDCCAEATATVVVDDDEVEYCCCGNGFDSWG